MRKIHRERIQKWVDALRSGKYQQTTNKLSSYRGRSFCCLGVAEDLYAKALRNPKWWGRGVDRGDSMMSVDALRYFGLGDAGTDDISVGISKVKGLKCEGLIDLNDNFKWTFKRIATAIEKAFLK